MAGAAPAHTIQQIAGLARAGHLDDAAILAARAHLEHADDPVLAALGGAVEFHRRQYERAVPLLRQAHTSRPEDLTIRGNLVESLYHCGDRAAARALCDPEIAKADSTLRFTRLAAFLFQDGSAFDEAIALYAHIVEREPADWSSWNNLGNCWAAYGDYPQAVEAFERALALAPDSQPIRVNYGNVLIEGGDPVKGEIVLKEAAELDPSDSTPWRSLYDHYLDTARDEDAYRAIRAAAERKPDDPIFQTEFGREAGKLNHYDLSDNAYRRALELEPNLDAAFIGLASNRDRTNREHLLDPLRDEAEAAAVHPATLDYIDALRLKRASRYAEALEALDRSSRVLPSERNPHLRGLLLDRLGRHDEAFATFVEMNRSAAEHASKPRERAKTYRDLVSRSQAALTSEWVADWTPPVSQDWRRTPVFLGSFPRSGTTLLDTMLMADKNAIVLEEQPYIARMQVEAGGVEALAAMSEEQLVEARETYWKRVATHGDVTAQTLVIDKQPLHTNNVPAILRLFPDAKFILAMRHPCDVLLSCFLTNFRTNIAMANFLDLEDAATLYDQTFSHWEQARAVFGLPVHTVVYERLVEDKARELRPLFDWLGLEWPGDEHDHREAARARGVVATASYSQVTEPLYKRAAGRWHKYIRHLEPVLPVLRPWVERFGYSLEDGRIPPWPDAA